MSTLRDVHPSRDVWGNDPGRPAGCAEAHLTVQFPQVGNEVEGTRHFWDFFSQDPQPNLATYLSTERSVCGLLLARRHLLQLLGHPPLEAIQGKRSATELTQW